MHFPDVANHSQTLNSGRLPSGIAIQCFSSNADNGLIRSRTSSTSRRGSNHRLMSFNAITTGCELKKADNKGFAGVLMMLNDVPLVGEARQKAAMPNTVPELGEKITGSEVSR